MNVEVDEFGWGNKCQNLKMKVLDVGVSDVGTFKQYLDDSKRGKPPKMDGENNGSKPYEQMDDLWGVPIIFGSTPICSLVFCKLRLEVPMMKICLPESENPRKQICFFKSQAPPAAKPTGFPHFHLFSQKKTRNICKKQWQH